MSMKSLIGIGVFIVMGLVAAILVGFWPVFSSPLPYDIEQTGLKDRIIIKFSHVVAENTPKGLAAEYFARLVKAKTNERVEIQVFPNGILYTDKNEVEALRRGDVQMIAPASSNLAELFPTWQAIDLPFAFPSQEALNKAFGGPIGSALFQSLEYKNMKGLAFWMNGFKQMTSSQKPLIVPDDFKNQTFRILPSPVIDAQFKQMGARTLTAPFNEVFRLLEQRKVDGQENTISNIFSKRLYKVQQYMTISNHGYLGYAVIMNKSFWDRLPADIQQKIAEAMDEATEWANRQSLAINEKQLQAIEKEGGIEIHYLTAQERRKWVAVLNPVYDQFSSQIGGELVKQIKQLRDSYTEDD